MRRKTFACLGAAAVLGLIALHFTATGQAPGVASALRGSADTPEKKFEDFDKVVKGAKVHEGLFKLHQKDDKLFAELRPDQFDRPLLCPIAIARGMGMGGDTLNFDDQWVLVFRRVGDKVHLIRRNIRFTARPGSPLAKAVETTYTDSILMALRIQSINPMGQTVVINLNDIFMTDFAELGLGMFDSNRSYWHKVKTFPKNIELQIAATYSGFGGRSGRRFGGGSSIDPRGNTVVIHYGLCQLPEGGYQPRLADDRVGHFLSVVKDFSTDSRDSSFLRYVNRWRLERAEPLDPKNPKKLSAPKKKIVFWIEKSVPDEYRAAVREGILEWNRAFEKIGFRDAIEVRQQESEDFDPEDINYNTFRWITTGRAFAVGPSRANPLTGEIMDADILFDADWIRYWKQDYQVHTGNLPTALAEPPSKIMAIRKGWGLSDPRLLLSSARLAWNDREDRQNPPAELAEDDPRARLLALRQGICQCTSHMHDQLGMAEMALIAKGDAKPGDKVPEELLNQLIKEVVMHEVGHTLGLRHNFKASTMLKNDQLNDTSITRKQGMVGSVMDYNPINLAPKGVKQGDYTTTTIGPYDYWVIEYAYKPLSGGTEGEIEELRKIACKGALAGNDYATDEDMYGAADPLVNAYDLGDPLKYAQDRIVLAEELMKDLADRVVDKGEGYQRARRAFSILLGEYGNAAHLVANFVGGEHMHRDHKEDPSGRDPFIPVKADRQREALKFLQDHILTDKPFQFPPALLRKLAAERWSHWGAEQSFFAGVEYPLYERILNIQRIVLGHTLSGSVLARIQNNALKCEKDEQPLTTAEAFRSLTDSIWSEYPTAAGKSAAQAIVPLIRRNLQREHVKNLSAIVLGQRGRNFDEFIILFGSFGGGGSSGMPADARSLARMHLNEVGKRITVAMNDSKSKLDDTTRAHLEECQERIGKVLSASMQANEP